MIISLKTLSPNMVSFWGTRVMISIYEFWGNTIGPQQSVTNVCLLVSSKYALCKNSHETEVFDEFWGFGFGISKCLSKLFHLYLFPLLLLLCPTGSWHNNNLAATDRFHSRDSVQELIYCSQALDSPAMQKINFLPTNSQRCYHDDLSYGAW